ncbi:MAG: diaminopimelate epimerase [Rickettsiales bacterium]|nr:MAG: diaminopimelate epimerase [Rickettsiales bacterium]
MTAKIAFVKMHGLGNDFVIMEENALPTSLTHNEFAAKVADRKVGIGCDQFITYQDQNDYIKMTIYNQDGSNAKACGNASRCLSKLIYDKSGKKDIILDVEGRKVICNYLNPDEIKINMGDVSFNEKWMPKTDQLWLLAQKYMIEPKEMLCVDVGNPHLVIFSELSEPDKNIIGKNFQNLPLFPEGINVNFAKVDDDKIYLKVWERGTGFTYACGSGAIATYAAANKLGFTDEHAQVVFELGILKMQKEQNNISMIGPASHIFYGEFIYG